MPPIRREPRPSSVTGCSVWAGLPSSVSFASRAWCHSAVQLPGVDAMSRRFEPLLQTSRKREIHVVAAEQDVIADRDALEREVAIALADRDQAEIGRAAADVAHEHEIADADPPPPADRPARRARHRTRPAALRAASRARGRHCAPRAASARAPPRRMTPAR